MPFLVALALLLLVVPTAEAQRDRRARSRADTLFHAAEIAYDEGRYEAAAQLLEEAISVRPTAAFQFNLGRCYERLERWDDAERAYLVYLASIRDRAQRQRVEERLAVVREESARARQREEEARAAAAAVPLEPEPAPAPIVAEPSGPSLTPVPFVLGGVGIAGLAVGGALTALAFDADAQSQDVTRSGRDAADAHARANDLGLGATVAWAVGAGLLVTGTIWLIVELSSGGSSDGDRARISEQGVELRF
ncbi:tetratricopeptide repeat protein [Sandaracinus amylolyticus]|uniref:tetratricopeptide repeat protein n=1 Tax=Sandaracinus amylolyticus TaxID=927083 RepID=UPI001F28F640|nr:tetratricopeptide repeat protein [Sandaracinus amylolyticus]UJR83798.1 Hypothetical protein I5071_58690 [Sandaracinus amylolyticus]